MIRDEEVDAFFKLGDEGTYAGGPHSIAPVTRAGELGDDELAVGLSTEQLERRDRMKRLVTKVVGSLGTAVMVLLPFKLGAFAGPGQKPAVAAQEPSVAVRPFLAAVATVARPAPVVTPAPARMTTEPVTKSREADPAPALAPSPSTPVHARAAHRTASAGRVTRPAQGVAMRRAVSHVSMHPTVPTRASRGLHVPPTATFPD